jgi:ketosteroid isomerase-like protein
MAARPRSPEDTHRLWADYFNAGDLEALVSLYDAQATLASRRGAPPVSGTSAIREVLASFLSMRRRIDIEIGKPLRSGDIALMVSSWRVEGVEPDGASVKVTGRTADVVRQQPDGSWRFVIDSPFGEGA